MSDEEDTADPTRKASRRDKFKERLARTKTKLSKKDKDAATTVDDFLATGRTSVSTGRPSVSDSLSLTSDRAPSNLSHYHDAQENQQPTDFVPPPQQSPRRIVVPKIDVSTSQRYPGAQPVQTDTDHTESSLLKPHYQARSQSSSSLAKGRGRARGLSVQFVDRPPLVIGEGGDEAEAPPIEVGKAKVRARSASPLRNNGPPPAGSKIWNKSPLQHIPRPGQWSSQHSQQPSQPPPNNSSRPESRDRPGIHRVPTGMIGNSPSPMLEGRQAIDREFDMSLGLSPATTISPSTTNVSPVEPPVLHAPTPIRPPVAVPNVREAPILHELKSQHGTKSLRNKFDKGEGHVLRQTSSGSGSQVSPESGASEGTFVAPPPGPPPARRPPDEQFAPPPGPPPSKDHLPNGYQQPRPGPGPGSNYYSGKVPSHPPPPPPQISNGTRPVQKPPPPPTGPDGKFAPHPLPPPRQAPDDEYMGWVPDSAHSNSHTQTTGSDFPGIDGSGKLAPLPSVDEDEDTKPEKSKRRWFKRDRRGS
jgi:hypothetical protein